LRAALRAFPTLLRVGFADAVAYRAEFLIWLLSTNMPLVMLALWNAVAREHPVGQFGQADFIAYYLAALLVRLLTGAWVAWEINYELRQGLLAFRLLRPVHPLIHFAAENLAALPLRALFALPIAVLSLWAMVPAQVTRDPVLLAVFAVSVFGAWIMNFLAQAIIGVLGFFIHNSLSLFQLWFGLYMLLSGYLIPLALFPKWLLAVAQVLPFRYMLGYPVDVVLGKLDRVQALLQLGEQWGFILAMGVLLGFCWKTGMRRFVAYGG
jgi:ABC-2 type transport system permease protein